MRSLMVLLLILSTGTLFGGDVSKKAQRYFDEGKEHLNWDRFEEAIASFQKALEASPDFLQARGQLAMTYQKVKDYESSYKEFQRIVHGSDQNFPKNSFYQYAKMAFAIQEYDTAAVYLQRYKSIAQLSPKGKQQLERLERNIQFAKEAIQHPFPFNPKPLNENINTGFKDYYPSVSADGRYLIFTRQPTSRDLRQKQEDIYISEIRLDNGEWSYSQPISSNINTDANEAAASISPDGRTLYFTICEGRGGYGGCDIYYSQRFGNVWDHPKNLGPEINTRAKETQPFISSDGMDLYFVSSRPGGQGALDIWVSRKQENESWGTAENLGPLINTPYSEERPFIHPDNQTLYFSSVGHPGFGSADIFLSRRDAEGNWQTPENFGSPLNTYDFEGGLFVSLDGKTGYFATDHYTSPGNWDIFKFDVPLSAKPETVTYVQGVVFDKETKKELAARVDFIDLENGKIVNTVYSDEINGKFLLCLSVGKRYALNIHRKGYLFHSRHFELPKDISEPYDIKVPLKALKEGNSAVLNNVFFPSDGFQLSEDSRIELDRLVQLLNKNPGMKIEIGGHTDNVGSPEYNKDLSEKRAGEVVHYLEMQGIESDRLTAKGYGETVPVADNSSEAGRSKNRRTEFTILKVAP